MRDLALATLASGTALIALYGAGLVFVAQHVADRYTPLLYPVVFLRVGFFWLGSLGVVILGSLATAMIRVSFWTNVSDAVLLIAAVLFTILGLYQTFRKTADRRQVLTMVNHLKSPDRITALRDLMWNSVNRGDVTSTEYLLHSSPYGSEDWGSLLDWTTQYTPLLEQSWLRRVILDTLTSGEFDDNAAKLMESTLKHLVVSYLDHEWYDSIGDIILNIARIVCLTSKFTEYHRYVIFDLGFNLYYVGDEGSATPRSSQLAPDSLRYVQDLFLSRIITIRRAVVRNGDPASVTEFCMLLERLAESGIGLWFLSSQIWEILEGGYGHGLVEQDALESLASTIGSCRFDAEEVGGSLEDGHEYLDRVSAHLALYIVKLGYQSQLGRMMGNAQFGSPKRMPPRFAMTNGLSEEIYTTVARELGYKSWPGPERYPRSVRRPRRPRRPRRQN